MARRQAHRRDVIFVLNGGPTLMITDANGKPWTFEDHPYCGPNVVQADGSTPADPQPGQRSPFWRCVNLWIAQGRRRNSGGTCLWEPEPEPELFHLGGRNYAVAGSKLAQRAQAQKGQPNA